MAGYSSADDYEAILIQDVGTDHLNDMDEDESEDFSPRNLQSQSFFSKGGGAQGSQNLNSSTSSFAAQFK